jgi:hypothetical protein
MLRALSIAEPKGIAMRLAMFVVFAMLAGVLYGTNQYVIKQIASGELRVELPHGSPIVAGPIDWSKAQIGLPAGMAEDIKRYNAENLAGQIRDSQRRMEDMAAYTRNPAGWHGLPPH